MTALQYKVGFPGIPSSRHPEQTGSAQWTLENLQRLKRLGFNTIQLNIAWGSRPDDEPLNLEDVVALTPKQDARYPQPIGMEPFTCWRRRADSASMERRRADLTRRIALCRKLGLRTIFHFGAPYNAHNTFGGTPPNCLSDPKVARRYELLMEAFCRDVPGVDDILLYTYDQDAWLCSEFEDCPRCKGKPLHERLVPFLDRLTACWRKLSPKGRLWWEPWELSAGQVYRCVESVKSAQFGLAIHCNTAECQATLPVDRWFKNTSALAQSRNIPVLGEYFLGGPSEELEPLASLSHPLVTLRGLQALAAVPGVVGIKEYYGLVADREDPNLRMTGLFFHTPTIAEPDALRRLAKPYGDQAKEVAEFWKLTSSAMEFFPWDLSWFIREVGRSDPSHSLSAAMLRGQQCHTPSWDSTRHAIFMKTDNAQPHPWMLEDIQIRCEMAGARMGAALALGQKISRKLTGELAGNFRANMDELAMFRRRALAYAYHLRETNLAMMMRDLQAKGQPIPAFMQREMGQLLAADLRNQAEEKPDVKNAIGPDAIAVAIALFRSDLSKFLQTYFLETEDRGSKGVFSVTSR